MKCPVCVEKGLKSKVFPEGGSSSLMGHSSHYDEEGLFHDHNPNTKKYSYHCSNEHRWLHSYKTPCANCNWGEGTSKITILEGE